MQSKLQNHATGSSYFSFTPTKLDSKTKVSFQSEFYCYKKYECSMKDNKEASRCQRLTSLFLFLRAFSSLLFCVALERGIFRDIPLFTKERGGESFPLFLVRPSAPTSVPRHTLSLASRRCCRALLPRRSSLLCFSFHLAVIIPNQQLIKQNKFNHVRRRKSCRS